MRKVIYALATNCKSFLEIKTENENSSTNEMNNIRLMSQLQCDPIEISVDERSKIQNKSIAYKDKRVYELFEGVSLMLFYTTKGVKGRLHSKAIERLRILWTLMFPITNNNIQTIIQEINNYNTTNSNNNTTIDKKKKKKETNLKKTINFSDLTKESQLLLSNIIKSDQIWKIYSTGRIFSFIIWKIFRHITPSVMFELWEFLLEIVNEILITLKCLNNIQNMSYSIELYKYIQITLSFLIEILYFAINHSNGRGINHKSIQNHLINDIVTVILSICEYILPENSNYSIELIRRTRILFCQLWKQFPNNIIMIQRIDSILKVSLPSLSPEPAVTVFAQNLLPILPYAVVQRHLLQPILTVLAQLSNNTTTSSNTTTICEVSGLSQDAWLGTLLEVISRIHDPREDFAAYTSQCSTPSYDGDKHSSVGQEKKNDDDEDSWNASDSEDAADLSDSESDRGSNSGDDSNSKDSDNEDKMNKQPYAAVSKAALSALLQNPENIAALAVQCLTIVQQTFNNNNNTISTTKNTGKTPKKSKKQSSTTTVSEQSPVSTNATASLLAIKCLNWFLLCIPQVLLQQPACKEQLLGMAENVHSIVSSTTDSTTDTTTGSTALTQPFIAELMFLTGRLIELDTYLSNKPSQLKGFVHDSVLYLQHHPTSISLSWAVQSLLTRLSPQLLDATKSSYTLDICLTTEEKLVFMEIMSTSLTSPSYWLRYNWLRILTHLPLAILADIEADIVGAKTSQNGPSEVNIAKLCLEAMCLSPDIRHEREYARRIGVLEVHLRNGRMSQEYMRIVCGFCLGLLHFKFKPIWEPAVLVLVSAGKLIEGEATIWPLLLKAIETTTIPVMNDQISNQYKNELFIANDKVVENSENIKIKKPLYEYIIQINNNNLENGNIQIPCEIINSELFYYSSAYNSNQLVEPDARTDFETYSATVWNILKRSPNITLKRSKIVVGMFLK